MSVGGCEILTALNPIFQTLVKIAFSNVRRIKRISFPVVKFIFKYFFLDRISLFVYIFQYGPNFFLKIVKKNYSYLPIKVYIGTSEKVMKIQIWTSVSTYLLVDIIKKELISESFFK